MLLQTARAITTNDQAKLSTRVRILLDSASQRSYVTEQVCSRLRLKPIHTERLQVNTYGGEQFKTKQCKLVKFDIHKSKRVSLTAICYPVICSMLPSIREVDNYAHLSSLELVDCSGGTDSDTIEVLVGSDYYWKFVTGETHRGTDGYAVVHSVLRWLLSRDIDSTQRCKHIYTLDIDP